MKLSSIRLLPLLTALCLMPLIARAQETVKSSFDPATGTITDARWKSGVPLGGIGVGKIELLTDGGFGDFTNQHNWDRPYGWAKGAFAAVRVQAGNAAPVAKLLRRAGTEEYAGVTNVAHTHFQGWFPRAEMVYEDADLPIQVRLEAFSPLIPHDPKNSALPVACLAYTLTNPTHAPVKASVLLAWPNLLGWGGRKNDGTDVRQWNDLTGDSQTAASAGPLKGLRYATTQTYTDQHQDVTGEYFVGVRSDRDVQGLVSTASWDAAGPTPSFWTDFVQDGQLGRMRIGLELPAAPPKQPAGAVSAEMILAPGQSKTLRFYVAWAMPHHVTARDQSAVVPQAQAVPAAERWTTSHPLTPGDQLTVDLGRNVTPTRLTLDQTGYPNDYPRGLRVELSEDKQTWKAAAQFSADAVKSGLTNNEIAVPLTPAPGRYLRLTNLGADTFYWWSIHALRLTVPGEAKPLTLLPFNGRVQEDVGHYWQNWWHSAAEIAQYADKNNDKLLAETRAWQDPVRDATLPFWLKLKLINCVFPLYSNTILTKDGRFVVQESPVDMGGATGTMDQRMAAHAFYTMFFPELDRAELEMYASCQQPDGRITHFDGNIHEVIGRPDVGYGITDWPDLSSAWVLQAAKLYRWTGDAGFLGRVQPHITKAMDWLEADGKDDDLIPAGGSTYDYEQLPRGAFIYSASCYLGALRAAAAVSDADGAARYNTQHDLVQQAVMRDLWNGTFFRKWKQPVTGKSVEDSFVANLAGDWLARLGGLPRTLAPDIIHQSITQTIARHQKPFFPVPPMQVTPEGKLTTSNCYLLQHEPYLGCEAIYENYVDDGLETLHRVYECAWELNHSPWNESLVYDAPSGAQGGLITYMTAPTSWHVLPALGGLSLDLPHGTLFVNPRLATGQTEMRLPVYFSRFWGRLDYVPAAHRLTLHVDRVFADDARVEKTLYHTAGPAGTPAPTEITLTNIAADGDSVHLPLPAPFTVRPGATLDLSAFIDRLAIPAKSEVVNFSVKAVIQRPGLPSENWKLTDNLHDSSELAAAFGSVALDGNPNSRWTTGRPMQPGDRLTLDMGQAQQVAKIVLDSAGSPNDYPRGYVVESSADGQTWTEIARATADEVAASQKGGVVTITFPPVQARYLRITNQGLAPGTFWSVHEMTIF